MITFYKQVNGYLKVIPFDKITYDDRIAFKVFDRYYMDRKIYPRKKYSVILDTVELKEIISSIRTNQQVLKTKYSWAKFVFPNIDYIVSYKKLLERGENDVLLVIESKYSDEGIILIVDYEEAIMRKLEDPDKIKIVDIRPMGR